MATAHAGCDQGQRDIYRRTRGQVLGAVLAANVRRRGRERRRRPVILIDALVEDLEVLHLMGRRRVPDAYRQRIDTLRAVLPPDRRSDLHTGITITHLLDALFDLRTIVMRRLTQDQEIPADTDLPE